MPSPRWSAVHLPSDSAISIASAVCDGAPRYTRARTSPAKRPVVTLPSTSMAPMGSSSRCICVTPCSWWPASATTMWMNSFSAPVTCT